MSDKNINVTNFKVNYDYLQYFFFKKTTKFEIEINIR